MHSRNKPAMTAAERRYVAKIKQMACEVCQKPGPSDAHEIVQGAWFLSIPLCRDCHMDGFLGIHGKKRAWSVRKLSELDALNETLRRLNA